MKALDVITFGESMAMFYAKEIGELHQVHTFQKALAGAESNVAVGLARLGFSVGWMSKVGADSLGTFILEELQKKGSIRRQYSVQMMEPKQGYCLNQKSSMETLM